MPRDVTHSVPGQAANGTQVAKPIALAEHELMGELTGRGLT